MKTHTALSRLLLQLSVLCLVLLAFEGLALAQSPGGNPVPPITTAYVVTMVLGILLGFLSQGLKTGNVLGLFSVQASWAPALAVVLTFGTGLEQGLTGQPTLTGAVWVNAIFTAFLGLLGQAGGATLHGHTHWSKPAGPGGGANAAQPKTDPVTAAANALPKPPASARVRGLVAAAGVLALALFCSGCTPPAVPPNVGPVVNGGLSMLACAWTVYSTDTSKVPPDAWPQIALDLASTCGMDVADFVNAFGASHPATQAAQANAAAIHAAASAHAKAGR